LEKATIHLENGNEFTVEVRNLSKENKYIQSVSLNSEPLERAYLLHEEIMAGGKIEFVMSGSPNKQWATETENFPDINDLDKIEVDVSTFSLTTTPPFETEDLTGIFTGSQTIGLKSLTPGAEIRYTLDGSEPTKSAQLYKTPITINRTTTLKAIAFSDLPQSTSFNKKYHRSYTADRTQIISINSPHESYGEADGRSMIDGYFGKFTFSDGWSGWKGNDMEVIIDLGSVRSVKEVSVGYMLSDQGWIMPPKEMMIEGSTTNESFVPLGSMKFESMSGPEPNSILRPVLQLKPTSARYLKVKLINCGQLPDWHGAAGQPSWMFLDEILVN
jgi:hypothetical protein